MAVAAGQTGPASRAAGVRIATVAAPGHVRLERAERTRPRPGNVSVRLEGCGVCASSLPLWLGRPWFTYPLEPGAPGHEGWGRVEEVGPGVESVRRGERVALLVEHAFAEYVVAPVDSLLVLPASLDDVPFPGEALGCGMNVFRRSGIRAGDAVAVVGVGFLGALVTRLAAARGARVTAVSRREYALGVARAMGANRAVRLDPGAGRGAAVADLARDGLYDVVVEATGHQAPLDLAGELVRERGRLVIAGYHQDGPRQVDLQLWNWRGVDVINAHERDARVRLRGIREAVDAVTEGWLEPTSLYTHRFPLGRLDAALDAAAARADGFMKALVMT